MKRGQGVECTLGNDKELGFSVPICMTDLKRPYCGCEGKFDIKSCPYGLMSNSNKCRSSSIIKCCVEKCNNQIDLAVIMDASSSIGTTNFKKMQTFVKNIFSSLQIGENNTRAALLHYNSVVVDDFNFLNFLNIKNIEKIIDSIVYKGVGTDTAKALKYANDVFLQTNNGMRSGIFLLMGLR